MPANMKKAGIKYGKGGSKKRIPVYTHGGQRVPGMYQAGGETNEFIEKASPGLRSQKAEKDYIPQSRGRKDYVPQSQRGKYDPNKVEKAKKSSAKQGKKK